MRPSFAMLLAALALAACGKSDKDSSHVVISGKDGDVTITSNGTSNGEHVTMKGADGKSTVEINAGGMGANVKLPDFVPLYPGAKVQSSVTGTGNGGSGGTYVFDTSAAPADVVAFYKAKSTAAGFAETLNIANGQGITFVASAASGKKSIQVVAVKGDNGSHVQVIWGGG
jgi:hypothetical protein